MLRECRVPDVYLSGSFDVPGAVFQPVLAVARRWSADRRSSRGARAWRAEGTRSSARGRGSCPRRKTALAHGRRQSRWCSAPATPRPGTPPRRSLTAAPAPRPRRRLPARCGRPRGALPSCPRQDGRPRSRTGQDGPPALPSWPGDAMLTPRRRALPVRASRDGHDSGRDHPHAIILTRASPAQKASGQDGVQRSAGHPDHGGAAWHGQPLSRPGTAPASRGWPGDDIPLVYPGIDLPCTWPGIKTP